MTLRNINYPASLKFEMENIAVVFLLVIVISTRMLQCWTSEIPFCGLCLSSLNWQHQLCKNPRPNPDIKTLFTDHSCTPPNGALAPTPVNLPSAVAKPTVYTSLGAHGV